LARSTGSSGLRKPYVLTTFNMRVALVKQRHTQIFYPLIIYLVLLSGTKAIFKDQWFPEVIQTPLWEPGSECGVYPDPNQKLGVACNISLGECERLANQTSYHLGVPSYAVFQTHSDLMFAMREADGLFYAGVTFGKGNNISISLPTLQQPMASGPSDPSPLTCRSSGDIDFPCEIQHYLSGCFLTVQLAAQRALGDKLDRLVFRTFPMHRMFVSGLQASSVVWLIPLYLCFLLLNIFNLVLVDVVTEKEQRLRDLLQVNGIGPGLYLISWTITNFVFGAVANRYSCYRQAWRALPALGHVSGRSTVCSLLYVLIIACLPTQLQTRDLAECINRWIYCRCRLSRIWCDVWFEPSCWRVAVLDPVCPVLPDSQ